MPCRWPATRPVQRHCRKSRVRRSGRGLRRESPRVCAGEHGVQVRGYGHNWGFLGGARPLRQDVSSPVLLRFPAERRKLLSHPLGARLLEEGRSGDTAEFQVPLVHPAPFPREELERLLHLSLAAKPIQRVHALGQDRRRNRFFLVISRDPGTPSQFSCPTWVVPWFLPLKPRLSRPIRCNEPPRRGRPCPSSPDSARGSGPKIY